VRRPSPQVCTGRNLGGEALGGEALDAVREGRAIKAGLRAGSVGIIKLAKFHGVGVGTVQRIKAALAA
jgi:hypothetical protein